MIDPRWLVRRSLVVWSVLSGAVALGGCGGGQKDAALIRQLHALGIQCRYFPCDVAVAMALLTSISLVAPAGADTTTNAEVSVGSPHDVAPRSHQNEPVVAMDAHNPDVLVAGSNDYIDQQACPQDIATLPSVSTIWPRYTGCRATLT